jgi:uncharacterized membrane protein YuzA (DUF378 family)
MKLVHMITLFLVVIGGLHLTLSGIGINLFGTVFGTGTDITTIFTVLIGLSTLYHVVPMLLGKFSVTH